MGPVIGDLLPLAVGVAISPIPIVATILMLLSANAGRTSTGFGVGWVLGILVVTGATVRVSGALSASEESDTSSGVSWVRILLGVALIALAAKQFERRTDTAVPGWMGAVDKFTLIKAVGLGALLSGINPKNLLLCVSAGVTIGAGDLTAGGTGVAVVIYTIVAASTVLLPVIGYTVASRRLQPTLVSTKTWLQTNNHQVMAIILLVMGVLVIGKGLGGL